MFPGIYADLVKSRLTEDRQIRINGKTISVYCQSNDTTKFFASVLKMMHFILEMICLFFRSFKNAKKQLFG